jgi:hypothetical protein
MSALACCGSFGALIDEAGHRGLAAVAYKTGPRRGFRIQMRSFDAAVEPIELERLRALPVQYRGHAKMAVHLQQGILFCPFCGKELAALIRSNESAFDELSAKHTAFMIET